MEGGTHTDAPMEGPKAEEKDTSMEGSGQDVLLDLHPDGTMNMPLFEEGWSAKDELILLEAIAVHGLGNWK